MLKFVSAQNAFTIFKCVKKKLFVWSCLNHCFIWQNPPPGLSGNLCDSPLSVTSKRLCQKWDSNPRLENQTATWTQRLRPLGHPDRHLIFESQIDPAFPNPSVGSPTATPNRSNLYLHGKIKTMVTNYELQAYLPPPQKSQASVNKASSVSVV